MTNNKGFSFNGKTLLSGVDPAGKAERIIESIPLQDRTLYLCPSPLYGFGLERLLDRIAGFPNSAVICVEAEPELITLAQQHISKALLNNSKFHFTAHCEAGALCSLIRQKWGPRFFRRLEMIRLNGGWQLHGTIYDSLAEALQRNIALDWSNAMTLVKLGRLYICNAMRNLALIPRYPSLDQLSFGNDPVLVLGAGPSLDTALDEMKVKGLVNNRNFRIICVDTCLSALQERGIKPDLAVILESQHWNLDDFIGLNGQDIPAALDLSALPQSTEVLSGNHYLFFTPWTNLCIFERLEAAGLLPARLLPLGSVGLSAMCIARRLSTGPIYTAGLDFSFTLDSYHARSTPGHKAKLRSQNRFTGLLNTQAAFANGAFSAISNTGEKIFSNPSMRNYRELFEHEFADRDNVVFDLTQKHEDIRKLGCGESRIRNEELGIDKKLGCGESRIRNEELEIKEEFIPNSSLIEKLQVFIRTELNRLIQLRSMLTGESLMDNNILVTLINECDYLWAHFPDYAASDFCPDTAFLNTAAGLSFLKRVRVEIDPFLKHWKFSLSSLSFLIPHS